MQIRFAKPSIDAAEPLVVGVGEGGHMTPSARKIDKATDGALARAIKSDRFAGRIGQFVSLLSPAGLKTSRLVIAGLGKAAEFDAARAERLGGSLVAYLNGRGEAGASVLIERPTGAKISPLDTAAHIALGARLRGYRFDKYRTKMKDEDRPTLARLEIMADDPAKARQHHQPLTALADGVCFTRDLVSEPANVIFPDSLARQARTLSRDGVKIEVLDEAQMKKLGMNALLAVGQGSKHDSRLVTMHWHGARGGPPIAFVGKGVTFDTGGISIKPAGGMEDMKWDMGGAGVVIGLMRALARRKAKVNAVGVIALVENMPSGDAQRPGDVVTSMSGQTIEVINTDAEGRLVLCDALWYAQDRFKPRLVIDLATLTGAIIVALGNERAGMFCNDKSLSDRLVAAGDEVGEKVWPMPLDEAYDKDIDSDIADMKNVGANRGAGSIAGAKFLQRFIRDVPWAHLDIAGVTWSKKDKDTVPKGATAFGVRLLERLVAKHYEGK